MKKPTSAQEMHNENEMILRGQERYNKRNSKISGSQQEVPHQELRKVLPAVSGRLARLIEEEQIGVGKRKAWADVLIGLDTDILSYIGLNCMYDTVVRLNTLTQCMLVIGNKIHQEMWAKGLQEFDKDLYKRLEKQVTKDHSSERYRSKAMRIIASKEGYRGDTWDKPMKIHVATPVVNAVLEACNIFDVFITNDGSKTRRYIGLTKEAEKLIEDRKLEASWASPMYGPMIVKPKPWTSFDTGVYLDPMVAANIKLVRRHLAAQARLMRNQFKDGQIPAYVEALNAVQETPLKINTSIVDAVEWAIETNQVFAKFPEVKPPAIPEMPAEDDDVSEDFRRVRRAERKEWWTKKRECVANLAVIDSDLRTAKEMAEYEQFFLGWSFDFRGRMYPVSHFNYHRDDHVKAMFLFARGKKLTEDSEGWLYIHLANTGDFNKVSKKSLDERIQWVQDNHDQIMSVAEDYKATFDYWSTADKPFQFLASCFEYKKLQEQGIEHYVCHMPISLDGTNSGVQHYAAALRSSDDGHMVNLVPDDKCQDVYQVVANEVNRRLKEDGSEEAQRWLDFGVGRSTVKRNVMTYGYSSIERGFGDQLIDDLMAPLRKSVAYGQIPEHPFGDKREQERMARWLAKVNYESVQSVIKSVSEGMKFLQAYSHKLASEAKAVHWTSPSGFPVVQKYTKFTGKRVKIFLYDRELKKLQQSRLNIQIENEFAHDKRKASSGVAPNFVHSLDAAHMHLTILYALQNGVKDFFLIHDSFGTTCDQMGVFYYCIRRAFVNMYEDQCVFENFEAEARDQLENPNEELPPVPTKGDLDIKSILDSEYCFS